MPRFDAAVELAEGYNRHFQLLGKGLQRARYLGYLLLSPLEITAAPHKLEIVDYYQADSAMLHLEPSGLGPNLKHRKCGGGIYEDGSVREPAGSARQFRPILFAYKALSHA